MNKGMFCREKKKGFDETESRDFVRKCVFDEREVFFGEMGLI